MIDVKKSYPGFRALGLMAMTAAVPVVVVVIDVVGRSVVRHETVVEMSGIGDHACRTGLVRDQHSSPFKLAG